MRRCGTPRRVSAGNPFVVWIGEKDFGANEGGSARPVVPQLGITRPHFASFPLHRAKRVPIVASDARHKRESSLATVFANGSFHHRWDALPRP